MMKLSVNETQWSSLLARTRALTLYISIGIFDFGPEKLPGLSRNGPLVAETPRKWIFRLVLAEAIPNRCYLSLLKKEITMEVILSERCTKKP